MWTILFVLLIKLIGCKCKLCLLATSPPSTESFGPWLVCLPTALAMHGSGLTQRCGQKCVHRICGSSPLGLYFLSFPPLTFSCLRLPWTLPSKTLACFVFGVLAALHSSDSRVTDGRRNAGKSNPLQVPLSRFSSPLVSTCFCSPKFSGSYLFYFVQGYSYMWEGQCDRCLLIDSLIALEYR